jgi:hypothetical protein
MSGVADALADAERQLSMRASLARNAAKVAT